MPPFVTNRSPNREAEDSKNAIFPYTYVGTVMQVEDTNRYAGALKVWINEVSGAMDNPASWIDVRYASPFYGIIAPQAGEAAPSSGGGSSLGSFAGGASDVASRQQTQEQAFMSYGMWMVPPDVGNEVLVCFINGQRERGVWFACLPTIAHGMIPAIGAPDGKTPMAEFDPTSAEAYSAGDLMSVQRTPYQPLATQLTTQGLDKDAVRGPITSSSFRETPSRVFGISTQPTPEAPGHSFVMDDGGADGKNKMIRIRSSAGNQITMSDDTGMIYMINSQGTGWVEISPSGHIDVYGEAGINMATKGDINFHADGNFNVHAGKCIKMVAMDSAKIQGTEELQLHGKKAMLEGVDAVHIHSCQEIMITSFKDIFIKAFNWLILQGKCFKWNSGTAKEAEQVPPEKPEKKGDYETTVTKAPTHEPFQEHDGAAGGPPTGADGSASGTGPGGMFGGSNTGGGSGGPVDAGGPSGASAISAAIAGNSGGIQAGVNTNVGIAASNPSIYGIGGVTKSATTPSTSVASSAAKAASTSTAASAAKSTPAVKTAAAKPATTNNSVERGIATATKNTRASGDSAYGVDSVTAATGDTTYTMSKKYYGGNSGVPTSQETSLTMRDQNSKVSDTIKSTTVKDANGNVVAQDKQQPNGMFDSQNPADKAATTPQQAASDALGQTQGQDAMSSIPAGQGGGETTCFEKGNNCERPADGGQPGTQSNGPLDVQGCAECYGAGTCSANQAAVLDTLAGPESGGAYNVIVGGGTFAGNSHPNVVGMTTAAGPSTAAGRYQITGTNYRNLGGGDFGKTGQDAMALTLARNRYGPSFDSDVASGNVDFTRLGDWTTTSGDANAQKRFQNSQAKYAPGGVCNTSGGGTGAI